MGNLPCSGLIIMWRHSATTYIAKAKCLNANAYFGSSALLSKCTFHPQAQYFQFNRRRASIWKNENDTKKCARRNWSTVSRLPVLSRIWPRVPALKRAAKVTLKFPNGWFPYVPHVHGALSIKRFGSIQSETFSTSVLVAAYFMRRILCAQFSMRSQQPTG